MGGDLGIDTAQKSYRVILTGAESHGRKKQKMKNIKVIKVIEETIDFCESCTYPVTAHFQFTADLSGVPLHGVMFLTLNKEGVFRGQGNLYDWLDKKTEAQLKSHPNWLELLEELESACGAQVKALDDAATEEAEALMAQVAL